jgi:hypothetical protein
MSRKHRVGFDLRVALVAAVELIKAQSTSQPPIRRASGCTSAISVSCWCWTWLVLFVVSIPGNSRKEIADNGREINAVRAKAEPRESVTVVVLKIID